MTTGAPRPRSRGSPPIACRWVGPRGSSGSCTSSPGTLTRPSERSANSSSAGAGCAKHHPVVNYNADRPRLISGTAADVPNQEDTTYVHRWRDGKIVEEYLKYDNASFVQQIGLAQRDQKREKELPCVTRMS